MTRPTWLLLLLSVPFAWAAPPPPGPPPPRGSDDERDPSYQVGGGTDWVWSNTRDVAPSGYEGSLASSDGVDLLRLLSPDGAPLGFVSIDVSPQHTVTESWRWRTERFPAAFQIRQMRESDPDDSLPYESLIRRLDPSLSGADLVTASHWKSTFALADTFTWQGFSNETVRLDTLPANRTWRACTLGSTTLYLQLTPEGRPERWYSTSTSRIALQPNSVMSCDSRTPLGKVVHAQVL